MYIGIVGGINQSGFYLRNANDRMLSTAKRSTSSRLLSIVEELKDGFCTADSEGDFIYLNRAALEMFAMNDTSRDYNFFNDVVRQKSHIETIRETLRYQDYLKDHEIEVFNRNGEKFPVIITLNIMKDPGGNAIGFSILVKDMTYIKKVQHQLFQAQKMESIGMLASGIAHEFNNILTGIIPNAELIKMTSEKDSANFSRAQSIQNSALRAAEIVKKLLSFARSDKPESREATDLAATSLETLDMVRKLFTNRIEIKTVFPDSLFYVEVDATRLQQIIMNLAINAKDAIGEDGVIVFRAENFILEGDDPSFSNLINGKYVKFQISDTGHGIEQKRIAHIFDPFYTTKEPGKGTGLGLSIIYGIINNLNGRIDVESEVNKGTTFTIYLPATDEKILQIPEDNHIEKAQNDATILVVDDERMILEMANDMLSSLGYNVMMAQNGEECLQLYRDNPDKIDLILLDLIMPRMNGVTCVEKLKSINSEVNVIITSGIGDLEKKKEIDKLDIRAFLEKPFSLKTMSAKIRQILEEQS